MQKIGAQFSIGAQLLASDVVNLMCVDSKCRSYIAVANRSWNNVVFFCRDDFSGLVLYWGHVQRINTLASVVEGTKPLLLGSSLL